MAPASTAFASWTDLYAYKAIENGTFGATTEQEVSFFDAMTDQYVGNVDKLKLNISSFPWNFILVPGPRRTIQLIHRCFIVALNPAEDAMIIGISGNLTGSSSFKEIPAAIMTRPLKPPLLGTRRGDSNTPTIPLITTFLACGTEGDFSSLDGGTDGDSLAELADRPNSIWIHPSIAGYLRHVKTMKAETAALRIITALNSPDNDQVDDDPSGTLSHEETRKKEADQSHHLLVFLWAVSKGWATPTPLNDCPDQDIISSRCTELFSELMRGPNEQDQVPAILPPSPVGVARPQEFGQQNLTENPALLPALIQNLQAMTASVLQASEIESGKRSMAAKLSPLAVSLLSLASASNWKDYHPVTNTFMGKLLMDKDATKAINLINSATRNWDGIISEKGLAKFFTTGYSADDIESHPGGLTGFMARPREDTSALDSLITSQQQIRSLLGDGKVSDDAVRHYAKNDFYLAKTLEKCIIQFETIKDFLDLLTSEDGIASEGYATMLSAISDNKSVFRTLFHADVLIGLKLMYFADRVFHRFIDNLGSFADEPNPIRAAKRTLKNYQIKEIESLTRHMINGLALPIRLPKSLSSRGNPKDVDKPPEKAAGGGPGKKKGPLAKADHEELAVSIKNPNVVKEWLLPTGLSYCDKFNPTTHPKNTSNWPILKHHNSGKPVPFCAKYFATGRCLQNCRFAHVNPNALESSIKDQITSKFAEAYKT